MKWSTTENKIFVCGSGLTCYGIDQLQFSAVVSYIFFIVSHIKSDEVKNHNMNMPNLAGIFGEILRSLRTLYYSNYTLKNDVLIGFLCYSLCVTLNSFCVIVPNVVLQIYYLCLTKGDFLTQIVLRVTQNVLSLNRLGGVLKMTSCV